MFTLTITNGKYGKRSIRTTQNVHVAHAWFDEEKESAEYGDFLKLEHHDSMSTIQLRHYQMPMKRTEQ